MHVLIVDDEPLAREELAYLVKQHPQVTSIAQADSVEQAIAQLIDQKTDLLFLDIHLTGESGFDLAEKLLKVQNPPYLVFATAYDQYALKAFQVNAKDYILKPFDAEQIQQVIHKASQANTASQPTSQPVLANEKEDFDAIAIQGEDRIYMVAPKDIYCVWVEEKTLSINTKDQTYQMPGSLNQMEQKLPKSIFIKTHRSYLINRKKVQEIQPWFNHTLQVILTNGQKVPVSRSYLKEFKEIFGI